MIFNIDMTAQYIRFMASSLHKYNGFSKFKITYGDDIFDIRILDDDGIKWDYNPALFHYLDGAINQCQWGVGKVTGGYYNAWKDVCNSWGTDGIAERISFQLYNIIYNSTN